MELQNCIGIETRHGYRTFELYQGDLTEGDAKADLLIVSAFAGSYYPSKGTLLESLRKEWGIIAKELVPELDLRESLGFWISEPIAKGNFKRFLFLELVGGKYPIADAISNVFVALAIADAKGFDVRTVAFPMLGAGKQAIDPADVMSALLPAARRALEQNYSLQRILLVDRNPAHIALLSSTMNQVLGRPKTELPKGQLIESLRKDIRSSVDSLRTQGVNALLLDELHRVLGQKNVRSFEIGLLARRLDEMVVNHFLGEPAAGDKLATRIGRLGEVGVATWVRSYLHTLRHFGNDSAHEPNKPSQKPPNVGEDDLAVCLFCMQRVIEFWAKYRSTT